MKRAVTAVLGAIALAVPAGNAAAASAKHALKAKPKRKAQVVTVRKTVTGAAGSAQQWGIVEVTLIVKKTTTTVGTTKTIKRTPIAISVPVFPNHTSRSIFINQQAIPLLRQETLQAHFDLSKIYVVSGATFTSFGFGQSLHSALLKAKRV